MLVVPVKWVKPILRTGKRAAVEGCDEHYRDAGLSFAGCA
jgi:hypothetical protein